MEQAVVALPVIPVPFKNPVEVVTAAVNKPPVPLVYVAAVAFTLPLPAPVTEAISPLVNGQVALNCAFALLLPKYSNTITTKTPSVL